MEAILAQMRAAQGIEDARSSEDEDVSGDVSTRATPGEEAARFRAMQTLCAEFAAAAKEWLGGRWYSHFESWLYARRAVGGTEEDGDPFPRGESDGRDRELIRKLRAAGASEGEATRACRRLAKASEAARRAAAAVASGTRFNDKAHRVRSREFVVGADASGDGVPKVELSCGKVKVEVNARHYAALRKRFQRATKSSSDEEFQRAAFCLLARYACLQGTHYKAGNMQAAIPPRVLDVLRDKFEVRCEMFASPLNAYLDDYCSASKATDAPFGSRGSAFAYEPEEGSFECNPPFDEQFISRLASHLERLLSRSRKKPLSFCVIVPTWPDSQAWGRLSKSVYCTSNTTLAAKEHAFVSGAQHSRIDQLTPSSADTSVIFLQNQAGERKWPVTEDALKSIREAFAPLKKAGSSAPLEKWDPDAPLGAGPNSRRLPAEAKSWVYGNDAPKRTADEPAVADAPKTKKKKTSGVVEEKRRDGAVSAGFFRE